MGLEPTTTGITILDSTIELQLPLIGDSFSGVRKTTKPRADSPSRFRRQRMRNIRRVRIIWSGKGGSNSRPIPWQGIALPAELFPHYF